MIRENIQNKITYLSRKIRNDNIFYFVSFPKSGRTWLELMMAKIYSDLTNKSVSDILNRKIKSFKRSSNKKKIPYIQFGHGYKNSNICLGNFFPVKYYQNKNIVLLVRDPRDIVVSFFHYSKYHYKNFEGNLSEFVNFDNKKVAD